MSAKSLPKNHLHHFEGSSVKWGGGSSVESRALNQMFSGAPNFESLMIL